MKSFGIYMKVPLNIFQCGIDKSMISHDLIENNKEFNYFFFDETDCEKFILNNYPDNVYNAYKSLIPFDYKWIFGNIAYYINMVEFIFTINLKIT